MDLSNSVAFVTGGSGGFGSHICSALAGSGANVVVAYASGNSRENRVIKEVIDQERRAIPIWV